MSSVVIRPSAIGRCNAGSHWLRRVLAERRRDPSPLAASPRLRRVGGILNRSVQLDVSLSYSVKMSFDHVECFRRGGRRRMHKYGDASKCRPHFSTFDVGDFMSALHAPTSTPASLTVSLLSYAELRNEMLKKFKKLSVLSVGSEG